MKYFKSIAWWAFVVLLYGTVAAGVFMLRTTTQYTKTQVTNKAAANVDSVRYSTASVPLYRSEDGTVLYTGVDYSVTVANGDTCCGDTNGVGSGTIGMVDTCKVILIGERDGTLFQIRRDSGTIPYNSHINLSSDSVLKGYDALYLQLYMFDTAANGDSIGWAPKVQWRLWK